MNAQLSMTRVFDDSLLVFLRQNAVEGETLESLIADVFDEMYSEENGPLLAQFALIALDKMGMRRVMAAALLESLHRAATHHLDIYGYVDRLERVCRRKACIPVHNGITHNNRIGVHRPNL